MTTTVALEQLRTQLDELRAILGAMSVAVLNPEMQPALEDLQTLLRLAWQWAQRAQVLAIQLEERLTADGKRPASRN